MRSLLYLLLPCLLLLARSGSGQTYFNERYPFGGGRFSGSVPVAPADSGGFMMAGQAEIAVGNFDYGLLLRAVSGRGQTRWTRFYQRTGHQYYPGLGGGMVCTRDGGYAIGGSDTDVNGISTGLLWRLNAQGDTLWTRRFSIGNGLSVFAYACREVPDGDFVVVGAQEYRINGIRVPAVWLTRTDSLGNPRWTRTYAIGSYDYGYSVELTPDGGYVVSGLSYPTPPPLTQNDGLVLKLDSAGQEQWHRLLGTAFKAEVAFTRPTRDGGYIVASNRGTAEINRFSQLQAALYKLDANGQTIWQHTYGPSRYGTELYSIYELADGSFIAAGQQARLPVAGQVLGSGYAEGLILKVCADGDSLWYRTYQQLTGGNSSNYLRDLLPLPDGSFVGVGFLHVRPPDTGSNDAWAFRIDSAGYLQPGGAPITVQCRPLGLAPTTEEEALEVWPNPSPDGRYQLRLPAPATAVVLDALGREIWRGALAAGVGVLDLRAQPPGLYLLQLVDASGRRTTSKLTK